MAKSESIFMCKECGSEFTRWEGQCRVCKSWNTLTEVRLPVSKNKKISRKGGNSKPISLDKINSKRFERVKTGIPELDRVLSGGFIPGQVVLIAGMPGVGKSTLLLQLAKNYDKKVLYVSGEESESQVAMRARRMKIDTNKIDILSSNNIDEALTYLQHDLLIIDSIQTMSHNEGVLSQGSISQVRECAFRIIENAKKSSTPVVIVGHISKDGNIAGPKVLEHMVDTVLYMDGDKNHIFRLLKVHKNRFGDDSEVGIFEMTDSGLVGVKDYSKLFMGSNNSQSSGTVNAIVLEGSRAISVEIQALTTKSAFGYPKRAASGFSLSRLSVLIAVLQKRLHLKLYEQDVYLNVASGLSVKEPACDLAVCMSILSSYLNKPVKPSTAFFGEISLSGEVRNVVASKRRKREAKLRGVKNIVCSENVDSILDLRKFLI